MKPNFMIIGAARSGTTSLHKYLESHPDIFMSAIKEINYFSNPGISVNGDDWYFRHFNKANQKMIGEASTSYTVAHHRTDVPEKIYNTLGDIKLIYLLRDPIDRLISHYVHHVHRGEVHLDFEDIVKEMKDPMLAQGLYDYQIREYERFFSVDNIFLLTIEQLKNEPELTVRKLYDFLGVDSQFIDDSVHRTHNSSMKSTKKSKFGLKVLAFYHRFIEQRNIPYPFKKAVIKLAELGATELISPKLNVELEAQLMSYYADDVKKLAERYSIDVSKWRAYL